MAKKNSSKTATEKAMQAAEPKIQVFTGWQGVYYKDHPAGWEPLEQKWNDFSQTDLKPNFFMVQNNLNSCDNGTIETRSDSELIAAVPDGWSFTGVEVLYHHWLFLAVHKAVDEDDFIEAIVWQDVTAEGDEWHWIDLYDPNDKDAPDTVLNTTIKEMNYYEDNLIITTIKATVFGGVVNYDGVMFVCDMGYQESYNYAHDVIAETIDPGYAYDAYPDRRFIECPRLIYDPTDVCAITGVGDLVINYDEAQAEDFITRMDICYVYVNRFGYTLPSPISTAWCDYDPVSWSAKRYIKITGKTPQYLSRQDMGGVTGVDVYASLDNKQTKAFIGHVDLIQKNFSFTYLDENGQEQRSEGEPWELNWVGAMQDVSAWTNVSLSLPEENTTLGAPASHFAIHDSRLYYWGDPDHPYRLYVGGNPGTELSIARGLGGAFVDIEPGTGIEIMGTAKWKTYGGSNIITMMCGNPNTNMVKRFNLVETNTTITNEISSKGYMYEEVSNVIGCNSRWGYGVFADGLYSISRYGLALTTMAMEYNNQMRTTKVSEAIEPIFTHRLGDRLKDCRMVYIDGVIYIALSEEVRRLEPTILDQVILCYDVDMKAWYTWTHDEVLDMDDPDENLLHIFPFDSEKHEEGLGVITTKQVRLYPTTGPKETWRPDFSVLLETGEVSSRKPNQDIHYICQLELHFDYFVGDAEVWVDGVDYYGRPFTVYKKLNREGYTELMRNRLEWIRIDKYVESYRIRIKGHARFRLVSINTKAYTVSKKAGIVYGYDDHIHYIDRWGNDSNDQHYIDDYNNLRRALVP